MLNTGLVVRADKNLFNQTLLNPHIADMKDFGSQPNQRLLDDFARFLSDRGHKFRRDTLNVKPKKQRVVGWEHPVSKYTLSHATVLLSSNPFAGESYLEATVFTPNSFNQFKFFLNARSPLIIYQKLLNYGLISNPKKGGSDV